jgi:hypothetical protein
VTSAINRYYDPSTDQFLSVDPDVATTDQPYAFTDDDPLNAEDPDGSIPGRIADPSRYSSGNLQDEIARYLGPDVGIAQGSKPSKIVFYDVNDTSKEVVYNAETNVYRISNTSSGQLQYYDRSNDTWGTNGQLGDQGLANSHYSNSGESYGSVGEAVQQYSGASGGDGSAGDDGGEFPALGDLGLFLLFPSISQLVPSSYRTVQT